MLKNRTSPQITGSLLDITVVREDEARRPADRNGLGIAADEEWRVLAVVSVEVLEGAVGGLGVEQVEDRHGHGVDHSPDDVELPAQRLEANRRHFDDDEVGQPVRHSRHGRALGPHRQRVDLGWVQPGDPEHTESEAHQVDEEPDDRSLGHLDPVRVALLLRVVQQHRHQQEAEELHRRGRNHHLAAAEALDHRRRDERRGQVRQRRAGRDQTRPAVVEPYRFLQERRQVVAHDVDAAELLHRLRARPQQESPHRLRPRSRAAAHDVSPARRVLPLVLDAEHDLVSVRHDVRVVRWLVF